MESNKTLRISKILLNSFLIAVGLTIATGIALGFIFRPCRYTGKVAEIRQELELPNDYKIPSYSNDNGIANSNANNDSGGTSETSKDTPIAAGWIRDAAKLNKMFSGVPMAPAAVTPYYIEETNGKNLIFGGTHQFFEYCGNANDYEVIWDMSNIERSIQSREDYLLKRIERILLIMLPTTFILSYLILYFKKNKIKIVIN